MDPNSETSSNGILIYERSNINDVSNISKRIDSITNTLSKPYFNKILKELANTNYENAEKIVDYVFSEQTELNIKDSTKETKIKILVWLSKFLGNKSFGKMTKHDLLEYLNNSRKSTSEDSSNKWIGTDNGRLIILFKFFKQFWHNRRRDSFIHIRDTN